MSTHSKDARTFRMTPEEKLEAFPKGCLVKVKETELGAFFTPEANKMRERAGEVVGHVSFTNDPIVEFHPYGRKSSHRRSFTYPWNELDVLTDETEIARWKQLFADKAAKLAAANAKAKAAKDKARS